MFIQYLKSKNAKTGKLVWQEESEKYSFGIFMMVCWDQAISLYNGSSKGYEKITSEVWFPIASYINKHRKATPWEQKTFTSNLIETRRGKVISSKQFETLLDIEKRLRKC